MATASVRLPHTWRPFGVRMMGTVLGAALLALVIATWVAFGPHVRARFTPLQRATLIGLGLIAFIAWFALMRSRVTATDGGVVVVNGYRKRILEWSQVVAVSLRRGAPWAGMDLSDGTSISLIGIQGSDGRRAHDAVRELRRLVAAHTPEDPTPPVS